MLLQSPEEVGTAYNFQEKFAQLERKWKPHKKQVEALLALVIQSKKRLGLEWGRRTGKSEVVIALYGLWGQLVPGSQSFLFGPQRKEVKRIFWDSNKIETVLPEEWIDEMNTTEMQVFWRGSPRSSKTGKSTGWWILDGGENIDANRGIEPKEGLLTLDEAREIDIKHALAVLRPILARYQSPMLITSTPPDDIVDSDDPERPHRLIEEFDDIAADDDGFYSHATSFDNPHLSKQWLEEERLKLEKRGEADIFAREYLAVRTPKKTGRQFAGVMDRGRHFRPYDEVLAEMQEMLPLPRWDWYALTDPGVSLKVTSKSVWAWNFFAIHPENRRIYGVDEIDCVNNAQMTTSSQWNLARPIMESLYHDISDWGIFYDESESWYAAEMSDKFDIAVNPSMKLSRSKYEGFTLIKDLFLANKIVFTDRCLHTWQELESYQSEKSRDHHTDLCRYLANVSGYTSQEITKEATAPARSVSTARKFRYRKFQKQDISAWSESILRKYAH